MQTIGPLLVSTDLTFVRIRPVSAPTGLWHLDVLCNSDPLSSRTVTFSSLPL
ncbi:hypothetical protein SCLCIDRAFT_1223815 [Scleroderma citrinum Foug A]|uniref:Uncharacterized protein n=1 Tax=Scleroderma citrinum Foug A TaxID=1036808 RepID=A0A0C2YRP2_9AGAM|nr:hypothetical protein SCLCIDRAFT_1223815 [Scleroderma citrinum Foug A]